MLKINYGKKSARISMASPLRAGVGVLRAKIERHRMQRNFAVLTLAEAEARQAARLSRLLAACLHCLSCREGPTLATGKA
jgi:hypothetical protein